MSEVHTHPSILLELVGRKEHPAATVQCFQYQTMLNYNSWPVANQCTAILSDVPRKVWMPQNCVGYLCLPGDNSAANTKPVNRLGKVKWTTAKHRGAKLQVEISRRPSLCSLKTRTMLSSFNLVHSFVEYHSILFILFRPAKCIIIKDPDKSRKSRIDRRLRGSRKDVKLEVRDRGNKFIEDSESVD